MMKERRVTRLTWIQKWTSSDPEMVVGGSTEGSWWARR